MVPKKKNLKLKVEPTKYIEPIIFFSCFILLVYFIVYFFWVYPLCHLETIETKDKMKKMIETMIQGALDPSKLKELSNFIGIPVEDINISAFYNFFIFKSESHVIWCLINKCNKFSNNGNIVIAYYDKARNYTGCDILPVDLSNINTYYENRKLVVEYLDHYKQVIDLDSNRMSVYFSTSKNELNLDLSIDFYNATVPSFLPRYKLVSNLVKTTANETYTPNEWASQSPLIGNIMGGYFNDEKIALGNYWSDNLTASNNFFFSEYTWFFILTDDWIIYILFYSKYDNINSDICKPLIIKNRKENKTFCCSVGIVPEGFKTVDHLFHPIKTSYTSNPLKHPWDEMFDEYSISLQLKDIDIRITSIPEKSVVGLSYDYYTDKKLDKSTIKKEWDKKYIGIIENLNLVEHVNRVHVEINYDNKKETFEADQIVECIHPKETSLSKSIFYE